MDEYSEESYAGPSQVCVVKDCSRSKTPKTDWKGPTMGRQTSTLAINADAYTRLQ